MSANQGTEKTKMRGAKQSHRLMIFYISVRVVPELMNACVPEGQRRRDKVSSSQGPKPLVPVIRGHHAVGQLNRTRPMVGTLILPHSVRSQCLFSPSARSDEDAQTARAIGDDEWRREVQFGIWTIYPRMKESNLWREKIRRQKRVLSLWNVTAGPLSKVISTALFVSHSYLFSFTRVLA